LSNTRFCVKCGREFKQEDLINSLCVNCYLKYHGVFKETPHVELTICPKCGSWYFKGAWHPSLDIREVIRRELLADLHRFLYENISVIEVDVVSDIYKINAGEYGVKAIFTMEVDGRHVVKVNQVVITKLRYRTCDKCMRRTTGSHKVLVQVRFEPLENIEGLRREVMELLRDLEIGESIIEVMELREGLDIKFEDIVSPRKYVNILVKKYGAKTSESFKSTKYDFQEGKWSGVMTISVRIPAIRENDIVRYRGKLGIVKQAEKGVIRILILETGEEVEARLSEYWDRVLEKPSGIYIDERVFTVIAIDKSTIYLLNEETGELREASLTPANYGLKPGDKVIILSDGERELVVKKEG